MTQLAQALRAAGVVSPAQRLTEIATDAARANRRSFESARDQIYKAVRNDAVLLWALFEPYRSLATDRLLREAYERIVVQERRDAPKGAGGGQRTADIHCARAPATDAGADRLSEGARADSTPSGFAPPRSNLARLADKQAERAKQSVATAIRLSRLDTVLVGDKPIGDCTVAEVRDWMWRRKKDAREASRDVRFALSLVANLPGNAVIREWWKRPEEVDQMYQRAEDEDAA